MDKNRKYVIILSPDGSKATIEFDLKKLKEDWFYAVKRHAGIEYAEVLYPLGEEYPCLIDEEGKLRNMKYNEKATKICSGAIFIADFIVGDMAVTHFNGRNDLELLTLEEVDKINKIIEERMKNHE